MLDLNLLEQLIRCKPMSESVEAVNRATDIMREYLESHGVSCIVEELKGRKILYAATSGEEAGDSFQCASGCRTGAGCHV